MPEQSNVAEPTDIESHDPTALTVGITSASANTISAWNPITPPSYTGCAGDGPISCHIRPGAAIDDPEGFAAVNAYQAYVAGAANDAIVGIIQQARFNCVSELATPGCGAAHGLHGPQRLVLTPDDRQLHAATCAAWRGVVQRRRPDRGAGRDACRRHVQSAREAAPEHARRAAEAAR